MAAAPLPRPHEEVTRYCSRLIVFLTIAFLSHQDYPTYTNRKLVVEILFLLPPSFSYVYL